MKDRSILFVMIQSFDPKTGGVQMSTFKLSSFFSSVGYKTFVYSFSTNGHIDQKFTKLIHAPNENRHLNRDNLMHFSKAIDEIKPSIVINQMPYEHTISNVLKSKHEELGYLLLGCLRNTLFSIKLNLEFYLSMVVPKPIQPFLKNKVGYALLLALHKRSHARDLKYILDVYDYFVMFGPPNRNEIEYFIGNYKESKLAYIPNSIPEVVSVVPHKEKKILWLSRLSYKQKRADLILPVWKLVSEALPDWELDIVGDGDALIDITKEIVEKNIKRVTVHGRQNADEFFRRSPIYFMTSSFEGFPNTVIEAQSFASVPIVFNSYPMLDWIIEDSVNGVLIKPFDIEKMAHNIIRIAKDEIVLQSMMVHSLKNANRFVIDKVGQMWIDFFEQQHK